MPEVGAKNSINNPKLVSLNLNLNQLSMMLKIAYDRGGHSHSQEKITEGDSPFMVSVYTRHWNVIQRVRERIKLAPCSTEQVRFILKI